MTAAGNPAARRRITPDLTQSRRFTLALRDFMLRGVAMSNRSRFAPPLDKRKARWRIALPVLFSACLY